MIRKSFIILPGVDNRTESKIWQQGINHWDDFIGKRYIRGFSRARKIFYDSKLRTAKEALYTFDSCYFKDKLAPKECWRLFDFFKDDTVYLDIEKTGLEIWEDITMIGLYDGFQTKTMIKGINLDIHGIRKELEKYKMIVTFNGASFDLPFINRRYPGTIPNIPHLDLRAPCAQIGLRGGLKIIEKTLGITRRDLVEKMYGGDAVRLWKMYRASGDDHYLNLLIEYNEEDIINLKTIAEHVYGKLSSNK